MGTKANQMTRGGQSARSSVQLGAGFNSRQLDRVAGRPAARSLARVQGDADLYNRLASAGSKGRDWEKFANALVEYGLAVLKAWISTAVITRHVWERTGIRLPEPPVQLTSEDAEDLSASTVADALNRFRDQVLRAGRWIPNGGASLSTYWIGYCILRYPDTYRPWINEQKRWHLALQGVQGDLVVGMAPENSDPARQLEVEAEVEEALSSVQVEATQQILQLKAQGYSHIEIAELLDCTTKSIESRLARHWRSARAG